MKSLGDVLKDSKLAQRLGISFTENLCDKHEIKLQMIGGIELCSRCQLEADTDRLTAQNQKEVERSVRMEKWRTLPSKSVIDDDTIKVARFDNYLTEEPEQHTNKQQALQVVEEYKRGHAFNTWIVSQTTGVGKSHLAMAILKELTSENVSCLFVDLDTMLRKIKDSFSNQESMYTEQYFIDLCISVDFLVIDDLGAETGDINSKKQASEWTSKILRAIQNGRQKKSTIITTNLTGVSLQNMYDQKVISRLMGTRKVIKFEKTADKRVKELPF